MTTPRSTSARFSRRTLLRGLGVSMALPWMESLPAWGGEPAAGQPPVRLAVLFSGNGFHAKEWWAKGDGATMELGKVLEPMLPWRSKMNFIRGLHNAEAKIGGIHSCQTGQLLSGAHLAAGGEVRSGTSFDQIVAQRIGDRTRLPSLVLGCEESIGSLHKGYSMIYSSHISWSSPTTPTHLEVYPALAFDRLFRDGSTVADRSVLDAVLDDAKSMRRRISASDRERFDQYLTSVRDIEAELERSAKGRDRQAWRPTLDKPDMPRPADGLPNELDKHMRLMCDILVLAFQTDTTRICTLKLNNDHSSQRFPFIGVDKAIHHLMSHSNDADWLKVNQFFLEQIAYIAKRLDAIKEGERSLLDNSMIVYLSSMMHGGHDVNQLPIIQLGSGGGQIRTGRVIDCMAAPGRKACSLYLSLMDRMGVKLDRFGDADQRLAGI